MGTNYYLHKNVCQCCGRSEETLHIGKSSAGWHFSLHIMPEENIASLADWKKLWSISENIIKNEYGIVIGPDEMVDTITKRSWKNNLDNLPHGYKSREEFHRQNYSEPGLNGLLAHRYRATRTDGTYDLIEGEFS